MSVSCRNIFGDWICPSRRWCAFIARHPLYPCIVRDLMLSGF